MSEVTYYVAFPFSRRSRRVLQSECRRDGGGGDFGGAKVIRKFATCPT
jgi:hypothetical protein